MDTSLLNAVLLFFAATLAGVINAVAGGGSFLTFPALLFAGVPPISANATSNAALWPGNAASVGAYRGELKRQRGRIVLFGVISLVGGLIGALLLLQLNDSDFADMIPYLMLLATVIFAVGPLLNRWSKHHTAGGTFNRGGVIAGYLGVAVYGGFFGAGQGILTLALLSLLGLDDIHEMNALKTLQATLINGVALVAFIVAGVINWPLALLMTGGAILGGYGGAAGARKLPAQHVRTAVLLFSIGLTIYFFVR